MKTTFYFNEDVKNIVGEYLNMFIVDNVRDLGEKLADCNTSTLLEEYNVRVKRLKEFSKWIKRDGTRWNIDTDTSDNFDFLLSLVLYIWREKKYWEEPINNLSILRVFQQVLVYALNMNNSNNAMLRIYLNEVDARVREVEETKKG